METVSKNLASFIDHTLLKPEAVPSHIEKLCAEAREHGFYSVCVNTVYVPLCKILLNESGVKVCAVVGFPLGAMSAEAKSFETAWAVKNGADEIDMVLQIGSLKAHDDSSVEKDISGVVSAAAGKTVKVIIETALLSQEEKVRACLISKNAKAHFVKTCTGFNGGGATVEDIKLMKEAVGASLEVKASGGIKDVATAKALIAAGASRLGTSSGVQLVTNQATSAGSY